uniref:CSON007370 protein n=2 Tax=Culicoides sonorensis TaxID=179676 RepID=A0A336LJ73_CULSO
MNKDKRSFGFFTINYNKYALQIYSITSFLLGLTLLFQSVWIFKLQFHIFNLLITNTYELLVIFIGLAGLISAIGSIFGICVVHREHKKCLIMFLLIIMISFLIQTFYGWLSIMYEKMAETELNTSLNETFLNQYGVFDITTKSIDFIQQKVKVETLNSNV